MAERLLCGDLPQARRKLRDFAVPLRRIRRERRRLCRVLCLSALEARLFHGHLREKNAGLCRPLPTQETRRIHGLLYPGLRDTRRFTATSRMPAGKGLCRPLRRIRRERRRLRSVLCLSALEARLFHGLRPCEERGRKAAVFSENSLHQGRNTTRPRKTGAFVESSLRQGKELSYSYSFVTILRNSPCVREGASVTPMPSMRRWKYPCVRGGTSRKTRVSPILMGNIPASGGNP